MIKKNIKILSLTLSSSLVPFITFAQNQSGTLSTTRRLLESIKSIIGTLIPIVFGLAVLLFFWGIVKFIWSAGTGKEEGKKIMLWGVVAIFVMSSIWGLVAFIGGTFGVNERTETTIPTIRR